MPQRASIFFLLFKSKEKELREIKKIVTYKKKKQQTFNWS